MKFLTVTDEMLDRLTEIETLLGGDDAFDSQDPEQGKTSAFEPLLAERNKLRKRLSDVMAEELVPFLQRLVSAGLIYVYAVDSDEVEEGSIILDTEVSNVRVTEWNQIGLRADLLHDPKPRDQDNMGGDCNVNEDPAPVNEGELRLVGHIGVGAGLCWLGDPAYIIHHELPKALGETWEEFCVLTDDALTKSFHVDAGHEGVGVVIRTGYGDGFYPVYVSTSRGRVSSVMVRFMQEPEQ
jgi:hypothetical protein